MKHSIALLGLLLAPLFAACATGPVAAQSAATVTAPTAGPTCPVTATLVDEPPKDPNSDAFGQSTWYINADRTLWAGSAPETWTAGPDGNKTVWIRPAGATLTVSGRRLDGDSPPLRADIPCCYNTGFQIAGLYFPRAGCWEVSAQAGASQLQFVLAVK